MAANSAPVKAGSWRSKGGRFARRLLRLDVQALDDIDDHGPFLVQHLPEVAAVARRLVDAEGVNDLPDTLGLAAFDHEIGKLAHDLLRSPRWSATADPAAHLECLFLET